MHEHRYTVHDHHPVGAAPNHDYHLSVYDDARVVRRKNSALILKFRHVFMRCIFITTPSLKNIELLDQYFPAIDIAYAPNDLVEGVTEKSFKAPAMPALSRGGKLRIATIGAMGKSKGSIIAQKLSVRGEGHLHIWHVGIADFNHSAPNKITQKQGYYDYSDALLRLKRINPHVIWFPAIRHEAHCYVLDLVLNSSYPIVTADSGSFPERITGD